MTINYASILALNPDLFPLALPQDAKFEGIELSAFRILHMLEQNGYAANFMGELNAQLKSMDNEAFNQIYQFVFTQIRAEFEY